MITVTSHGEDPDGVVRVELEVRSSPGGVIAYTPDALRSLARSMLEASDRADESDEGLSPQSPVPTIASITARDQRRSRALELLAEMGARIFVLATGTLELWSEQCDGDTADHFVGVIEQMYARWSAERARSNNTTHSRKQTK